MSEILTPKSNRWQLFTIILDRTLQIKGCDGDHPEYVHRQAKQIMDAMGDVDISASIEYFREHGGYCDCEILMNVDPYWGGRVASSVD